MTIGSGDAGTVFLSASDLKASNGAVVGSSALSTGKGGDIKIKTNSIELDGLIAKDGLSTTIGSTTFNTGDSGNVEINTSTLRLNKRSSISTDSKSNGNAGDLTINASDQIEMAGIEPTTKTPSAITSAVTVEKDPYYQKLLGLPDVPNGTSGNISINTPKFNLLDKGTVRVENQGSGSAGNLSINAEQLNLSEGGNITAASVNGEGGNINLDIKDLNIDDGSQISATAENNGEGGNIVINTRSLTAKKNSNVTTNAGGEGNGGNIQIDSDVLTGLENSDISASAIAGDGGNIVIDSDYIFGLSSTTELTPFSDITASSELGIDGTVKIFSPETNIGEEIIIVGRDERVLKERDLVDDKCTDINQQRVRVQDLGAPVAPSPFDFPYSEDLPEQAPIANSLAPDDEQIIQANTIKVLPDGRTFLVAETKSGSPVSEPQLCTRH